MDIVYVYQRKRKEFGRHPYFQDRPAEVIVDLAPDESLREQFVEPEKCNASVLNTKEFSEHEVFFLLPFLILIPIF